MTTYTEVYKGLPATPENLDVIRRKVGNAGGERIITRRSVLTADYVPDRLTIVIDEDNKIDSVSHG
jgi:hypothetical protein